jgi:hypothetical protein
VLFLSFALLNIVSPLLFRLFSFTKCVTESSYSSTLLPASFFFNVMLWYEPQTLYILGSTLLLSYIPDQVLVMYF